MHTFLRHRIPTGRRLLILALIVQGLNGNAEEKSTPLFSFDLFWNTYSAYIWRGKALDKDPVTQISAITRYSLEECGTFSMKVWSNWDLSTHQSNSKTTEANCGLNVLNFTPSYSVDFGPVGLELGHIWYTFYPRTVKSTRELFATVRFNNSVITPSLTAYYDYWEVGEGFLKKDPLVSTYFRFALDKSIRLNDQWIWSGNALISYAGADYNAIRYRSPSGEGFADYELSSVLSYLINDQLSVGAKLAFTGLIGGEAGLYRHEISPDEVFWGGLQLTYTY